MMVSILGILLGMTAALHPTCVGTSASTGFEWVRIDVHEIVLCKAGRPVLAYVHSSYDPRDIEGTNKPFHHVYSPNGSKRLTKGAGGLYPHHKGIFVGYNEITAPTDDRPIDVWHAQDGARTEHAEIIEEVITDEAASHRVRILWKDHSGVPFAEEIRTLHVSEATDRSVTIDFGSVLKSVDGVVVLQGDRHHAGVHFRARQDVADSPSGTLFLRPKAWADLDINAEIPPNLGVGLPWNAMQFSLGGYTYTVVYMSHPENPGPAETSERKYGRLGEFAPYTISEEAPLTLRYRFWITDGDIRRRDVEARYATYAGDLYGE